MAKIDIKTQRVVASLIHSRVIVSQAPNYVLKAIQQWVEDLDRAEGPRKEFSGFKDNVSVGDSAVVQLQNKEDNLN